MKFIPPFLFLVACAACPSTTPTPAPAPISPLGASDAGDLCSRACDVLSSLGCPEGASVDGGKTCAEVCRETQGGTFNINPTCIAHATTANEVMACGSTPCRR